MEGASYSKREGSYKGTLKGYLKGILFKWSGPLFGKQKKFNISTRSEDY